MSDQDALLAAIAAHPDEDTPRLVYADWLDEHDQPIRAEFIRVQIEIALKELLPRAIQNRYVDVWKRNQELLDEHRDELLGSLVVLPPAVVVEFRRGFVSFIGLPVMEFLVHSPLIASALPLPRVRVSQVAGHVVPFLSCPHTDCVAEIRGYPDEPDNEPPTYPDNLDLIDDIERFSRLEILDLERCGVNDLHCDLADNFSIPTLIDLDLSNNTITDEGVSNLLQTSLPAQLRRLILGGNPIGDAGAIELARRWPTGDADRLKYLNLKFTNIGQLGQLALLARFGGRIDLF